MPVATHGARPRWLLLLLQLPASPSNARVKTWRRLQQLGAVAIRNAVWVLPDSSQAREDFEWMKQEIAANKGEASVFAADTIDSLTDDDIIGAFRVDRERSFQAIRDDARRLKRERIKAGAMRGTNLRRVQRAVRQLRGRFADTAANDPFGAPGRDEADAAVSELEAAMAGPPPAVTAAHHAGQVLAVEDYRKRTWVTRPRPGIDRSGSAWLIRRFIDPSARFAFAEVPPASPDAIAFDMYDAGFSHEGDRCTFEVLSRRFRITDSAVERLGRLVHDLDFRESRYQVPETAAVARLIEGLRQMYARDEDLLDQGIVLFEAMYRAFTRERQSTGAEPRPGRRVTRRKKGP